jgi:DNA invertase Pin-like site-specific DNA recombinase
MNIVAYCRVSTDKREQLQSLETQKAFFEDYAEREGYNLVDIYADEGISGTKTKNRHEFLRMMKDSERGLFQMVVVKDISRLARNTVDFLTSIRALKAQGIKCKFITSNLSTEDGEMTLSILAMVAQEESSNTSKRIKASKRLFAEKGRVPNITYGYDKIKGDSYNLTINEAEVAVIKRIYSMYIEAGHGASKIALLLNQEGIKTKRGCNWSQNAICRILTNPIYVGKLINCKEEVQDFLTGVRVERDERDWLVHDRPEFRIIDDETFEKAGEILNDRNVAFNTNKTRQSNRHLFSTLIKCSECGYSYRRRVRTYVNTYTDWMCSVLYSKTTDEGRCCNSVTVDEGELIVTIEEYFRSLIADKPNVIKGIVAKFNRLYKDEDDNAKTEVELQAKLTKLNRSREKCKEMYKDGVIERDEMRRDMADLNVQIERVSTDLRLVQYNMNKGDLLEQILEGSFESIEKVTSLADMTNAQLKKIIDKIVVSPDGKVDIYLKLLTEIGLDDTVHVSDISTPRYNHKT